MSVWGKRQTTIGPGHDGGPKDGFYGEVGETFAHPHSVPNQARGMEAQQHTNATLGVPPKMKRSGAENIPIHSGMVKQTKSGPLAFGGDQATALDSLSGREAVPEKDGSVANAMPVTAPPVAKNYKPVETSPTMRRQQGPVARSLADARPHDIRGVMLLDEAGK
jgi:hypothetical protein